MNSQQIRPLFKGLLESSVVLTLLVCLSGFKTGYLGPVDIGYDFESTDMASGPDTFELFENTSSVVAVSSSYAFRGAYSLHLKDRQGNNDFPEFQGYFPTVNGGNLEVGFALMTPSPSQPFNIALAGDAHFTMQKHGLGFWLFNDKGTLRHMSNSIPKKLLEIQPFQWYWFDISINTRTGEYSLKVNSEFGDQLVYLEGQKHPVNAKGSSLLKYSFAGDLNDTGNANFYVDEFVLRTDHAESPKPLIAPGRRELFVDKWNSYFLKMQQLKTCLPPELPSDFIDIYNTPALRTLQANSDALRVLLLSPSLETLQSFRHDDPFINAIAKWALGCSKLGKGDIEGAVVELKLAADGIGDSPAVQSSLAIAYANMGLLHAAQTTVLRAQLNWPEDVRWQVLLAAIGFISGDLDDSEAALSSLATSIDIDAEEANETMRNLGWLSQSAILNLKNELVWNKLSQDYIVAEQYYFALLWQKRFGEAQEYARRVERMIVRRDMTSPLWVERQADAALFAKQYRKAERLYKRTLGHQASRLSALMKLSDVYFLDGDFERERKIRESIYGALKFEDRKIRR